MAEFKLNRLRYTWKGAWASGTTYTADDIVSYGGKVYVCLVGHIVESGGEFYLDLFHTVPNTEPPAPDPYWEQIADGYQWVGVWATDVLYNLNDLVKYGGIVYRCTTQHTSSTLVGVDSTVVSEYGLENDQGNWTIYAKTEDWKRDWDINTAYRINDIVKYGGIVYRCIDDHISNSNANNGLEFDFGKWQVVHSGIDYKGSWDPYAYRYKLNDVVTNGANLYKCTLHHQSGVTFDEAKWDVYFPGQQFEDEWNDTQRYQPGDVASYGGYSYVSKTYNFNSTPPTNAADWSLLTTTYNFRNDYTNSTSYKKGDVVRHNGYLYVCINDSSFNPTDTNYWEALAPGIKWQGKWSASVNYELGDIVSFVADAYRCKLRHTSSTALRPDNYDGVNYWEPYAKGDVFNRLRDQGDLKTYDVSEDGSTIGLTRLPIGLDGQLLKSVDGSVSWEYFGQVNKVYYVSIDGEDTPEKGTTIQSPWRTIRYACQNITGPATIFIKTGLYQEILPISIPAGVALVGDELRSTTVTPATGYETEDMFYVRNGSGIRNLSLSGLTGSLGALNQYVTRRPSGGAFVSLDPGTGTSDSSTWITTRSPYIQNVSTFGTGCVGLKVDGDLHAGGNKSIVANDFTQVISDGIGAWITNGGLSELVSVFSYYGYIGYLAENGGKIRATNGNSSYGTYGCVAEGVSLAESPIQASINNRSTQATVASAFSGNIGDEILILEYSHCGQEYASANYSFVGSGTGASVTPNYRNGAVTEVRVYTRGDSSAPGGAGYVNYVNNAQSGDSTTITLAANDSRTAANYLGMRLIITSGGGTGQYGYIQAYDDVTKIATIYKESDNTPGWDHLVSGTIIESVLTNSTTYSIEPRVTFSASSGTTAKGRAVVANNKITSIKIWDCGSGYISAPTITITDPNVTQAAVLQPRIANGALGPVTWVSRGTGYQTTTTTVTITGNGFADKFQLGSTLAVTGATRLPRPGANISINGIYDVIYKLVTVEQTGGSAGNLSLNIQVSPTIDIEESPAHGTPIILRERYSQVRLTGHDFLDIGTGNYNQTNYPELYTQGTFSSAPENEVYEAGGGRVFYTSTDQDGNFRVGELFRVEQATGIVTISAALFNLSGLEELTLGGITAGGTGTIIREFSTDTTFIADSNSIVPTQKAIKGYISARLSGGGSDAFTTKVTAGNVIIGPQEISSTTVKVDITSKVNFRGPLDGYYLALSMFSNEFDSGLDYQDVVSGRPS